MAVDPKDIAHEIKSGVWAYPMIKTFHTRHGDVEVPAGFAYDKYTGVPNTRHPEFHLPPLLHDYTRKHRRELGWTRRMTDEAFRDEMMLASFKVYQRLYAEACALETPEGRKAAKAAALDELWGLLHRTRIYYRGVSGLLGSLYIVLRGG